ncbi:hypothetical protein [Thermomonas mangrovi]|uniref:hypothetical protein n=1 Tax=Thermomonas mangrovi TaxID=2993316 RepID=UPI002307993C|nr:hypothetical protein [Thermomonas mangrovi]
MKRFFAIAGLSIASVLVIANADQGKDYKWSLSRSLQMDLDRNGQTDSAQLRIGPDQVGLLIKLNKKPLPVIEIPIDGSKQFGICPGSRPEISVVPQSEAPLNALGETPEGYKTCPTCVEIVIDGGECDSLQFYWNSVTKKVAWWRA